MGFPLNHFKLSTFCRGAESNRVYTSYPLIFKSEGTRGGDCTPASRTRSAPNRPSPQPALRTHSAPLGCHPETHVSLEVASSEWGCSLLAEKNVCWMVGNPGVEVACDWSLLVMPSDFNLLMFVSCCLPSFALPGQVPPKPQPVPMPPFAPRKATVGSNGSIGMGNMQDFS